MQQLTRIIVKATVATIPTKNCKWMVKAAKTDSFTHLSTLCWWAQLLIGKGEGRSPEKVQINSNLH